MREGAVRRGLSSGPATMLAKMSHTPTVSAAVLAVALVACGGPPAISTASNIRAEPSLCSKALIINPANAAAITHAGARQLGEISARGQTGAKLLYVHRAVVREAADLGGTHLLALQELSIGSFTRQCAPPGPGPMDCTYQKVEAPSGRYAVFRLERQDHLPESMRCD